MPTKQEIEEQKNIVNFIRIAVGEENKSYLEANWENRVPINHKINIRILDFMIKKKLKIIGKDKEFKREFIKKKNKKIPYQEIDDVLEFMDLASASSTPVLVACLYCGLGYCCIGKIDFNPLTKKQIDLGEAYTLLIAKASSAKNPCPWCSRAGANVKLYEMIKIIQ